MAGFGSKIRLAGDNEIFKGVVGNHCLIEIDNTSQRSLPSAKMVVPAIELCSPFGFRYALICLFEFQVVITNIGDATIGDESSEDGKRWMRPFLDGAMSIPGVNFAAWGRSYKYPEIAMHFIGQQVDTPALYDQADSDQTITQDVHMMLTSETILEDLFQIH